MTETLKMIEAILDQHVNGTEPVEMCAFAEALEELRDAFAAATIAEAKGAATWCMRPSFARKVIALAVAHVRSQRNPTK